MSSFQQAVNFANSQKSKKNLPNDQLLQLYSHYKQGELGVCNVSEPSKLQFKEHAKWKAWKSLGNMSKSEAQSKYVEMVNKWLK